MVMAVHSNADSIARKYRNRARRMDRGVRRGVRDILIAIERGAVERTSGPSEAEPGSYPVPVREGHLHRGFSHRQQGSAGGMVINEMVYASVIHDDRPFLQDSADATDMPALMAVRVRPALA